MPNISKVLINGNSYSWCNMSHTLLGVTLTGIQSIDFEEEKLTEKIYGAGCSPVAYGAGKYEVTSAQMTLLREETEALKDAAPNRQILDLPVFDIILRWQPTNGISRKAVLKNCKITKVSYSHQTQQTHFVDTIEMEVTHIIHE